MSPRTRRLVLREKGWCLAANRLCARAWVRLYFRAISRLGDGYLVGALLLTWQCFGTWSFTELFAAAESPVLASSCGLRCSHQVSTISGRAQP